MLFLDANTMIYYLHDIKPYSQLVEDIISSEDKLYTSIRIIDEAIFTIGSCWCSVFLLVFLGMSP